MLFVTIAMLSLPIYEYASYDDLHTYDDSVQGHCKQSLSHFVQMPMDFDTCADVEKENCKLPCQWYYSEEFEPLIPRVPQESHVQIYE